MADLKKYIRRAPAKSGHSRVSMNKLKVLITVVSRSKADFYMDHIQSFGVNMQMVVYGQGTAPKEIATAMGLTDSDRAVIFSIIGDENLTAALDSLKKSLTPSWAVRALPIPFPWQALSASPFLTF